MASTRSAAPTQVGPSCDAISERSSAAAVHEVPVGDGTPRHICRSVPSSVGGTPTPRRSRSAPRRGGEPADGRDRRQAGWVLEAQVGARQPSPSAGDGAVELAVPRAGPVAACGHSPGEAGALVGFGVGCLPGVLEAVSPVTTHSTNIRMAYVLKCTSVKMWDLVPSGGRRWRAWTIRRPCAAAELVP